MKNIMVLRWGGVWNVRIAGYWGEGYTQLEAVHHARFRASLHQIIKGNKLIKNDKIWDKYPHLFEE